MKTLTAPHVGINGSGQQRLSDDLRTAAEAVTAAIEALTNTAPHPRDYHPDTDRYRKAASEHADRVQRLASVYWELSALAGAVDEKRAEARVYTRRDIRP